MVVSGEEPVYYNGVLLLQWGKYCEIVVMPNDCTGMKHRLQTLSTRDYVKFGISSQSAGWE